MKKVLLATEKPFAKKAVDNIREIIEKAGMQFVVLEKYTSPDELIHATASANALIVRSDLVTRQVLEAAPELKIVVRAGAGYDNIDLKTATEKGVVVMNTPGQNANAVAELVFGLLIYLLRHGFNGTTGNELRGKKLGIHAYGYIGKIVAQIARGFGMTVSAYDPYVDKSIMEKDNVKCMASAEQLYEENQIVSLHLPANDQTKKSIHYDLLKRMPEGAVLVNTARKEIIHEESLLKMFEERKDFRYCADVAPDCLAVIKEKYEGRYFFTAKKTGAQTHEANNNAGIAAARQIVNFFLHGDTTFQVNK